MPVALLHQCAPRVAAVTMAAIVQQESGGNPLALHDNTSGQSYRPATLFEAVGLARRLIAAGHSIDMGIAQINSGNLPSLHLGVQQVFDPCRNLWAAQAILLRGWRQSGGSLRGALSAYNTGNTGSAVGARYAAGVFWQAGVVMPGIPGGKLARWTQGTIVVSNADLQPVRAVPTWTPQASPLPPVGGGLAAKW
ncbi:lytic transglycosylase domain-containing protein [Thiomonas sp. X19]|uniref:lytic transglycosylase domain-containing protein n=1 Tax=Thiomonas sp. X19 TaxID=1050370 RepID=UPI0021103756|nr:lytic transglycosylase domain-containing protein [Thiomonas sp. X19]